jgi:hypothetical protein
MMPSKLTRIQKAAVIATVAAPIVAACVGVLLWLKGIPHSVQQSGVVTLQGDVTASTGGLAIGPGSTMNVVTAPLGNPQPRANEPSVYLECHYSAMPTRLPGGRVYVLNLWPMPAANGEGGLMEYFSLAEPPELKWPTNASGMPLAVQHCEITNDGNAAIYSIETAVQLQFREVLVDRDNPNVSRSGTVILARPWLISVPRLDPGTDRAFSFYIWNMSQLFAQVALPDDATGLVLGENQRRSIRIIHPAAVPMSFNPFVEAKPGTAQTSGP